MASESIFLLLDYWRNADGAEGIFGFCRTRVGSVQTHFNKDLMPYLSGGETENK